MEEVFREALNLLDKGEPFVIATVVGAKGSTPQKPGAKLLVREDGSGVGTLGGGCVEGDIWFAAKMLLKEGGGPTVTDYELNEDIAAREGLVCGGTMVLPHRPRPGAGGCHAARERNRRRVRRAPRRGLGHSSEALPGQGNGGGQALYRR